MTTKHNQRHRGAQPGNRNAWWHGRWSKAVITARKLSIARIKALALIAEYLGTLIDDERYRIAPLRPDQVELLQHNDRALHELVVRFGFGWSGAGA